MQATLEHARHRNHAFDLAWALFYAMYQLHGVLRDADAIDRLLSELQPLAREQRLLVYEHVLEPFCHAIQALIRNAPDEAAVLVDGIIPHLVAARVHTVVAEARTMAAKCAVLLDEPERALALIDEVLTFNTQPGGDTLYQHAEVLRVKGLALEAMGQLADAEAAYHSSIALARAQKAKWWELRTAASLARLWQRQGRSREGHELLAPICGWFTEGFDTPDLREASSLLAALRSASPAHASG
jgi:predicted ATPase